MSLGLDLGAPPLLKVGGGGAAAPPGSATYDQCGVILPTYGINMRCV